MPLLCEQNQFVIDDLVNIKKQNEKYCVSRKTLLMSNDVEMNPGPVSSTPLSVPLSSLQARLAQQGFRPLEVCSDGNCFFKSVSHQLYNDPSCHMDIRAAGVQYLSDHPERFIENIDGRQSWLAYLANMSQQGTWCDAIIVQAVSDALNLTIHITESNEGWAPITIISPVNADHDSTVIHIGHIDEVH